MTDLVAVMWLPLLACLVLVGIHGYLGLHILARGVIFVDLALAQIAAMGASFGILLGFEAHGHAAFWLSVVFTLVGAAIVTLSRTRAQRIPQEAVIGVVYAVAASAVVLVLDRSPHGGEELKAMLTGSILWVDGASVLRSAAVYTALGAFHWIFRERFTTISFDPEAARSAGWNVALWDFLFYATFGLVITVSVPVAGVLLVFCFLIVPSIAAALFGGGLRQRLAIVYGVGMLGSTLGCLASYGLDLPTGATVVCVFGVLLLACLLVSRRKHHRARPSGATRSTVETPGRLAVSGSEVVPRSPWRAPVS